MELSNNLLINKEPIVLDLDIRISDFDFELGGVNVSTICRRAL